MIMMIGAIVRIGVLIWLAFIFGIWATIGGVVLLLICQGILAIAIEELRIKREARVHADDFEYLECNPEVKAYVYTHPELITLARERIRLMHEREHRNNHPELRWPAWVRTKKFD